MKNDNRNIKSETFYSVCYMTQDTNDIRYFSSIQQALQYATSMRSKAKAQFGKNHKNFAIVQFYDYAKKKAIDF